MSAANTYMQGAGREKNNARWVFAFLWAVLLCLYWPAHMAGWVLDSSAWINVVRDVKAGPLSGLWEYLNITKYIPSLYQFTQLSAYLLYRLMGLNPAIWLLLFITMQAANAALVYTVAGNMFKDTGVKNGAVIAFGAAFLFCICPHISEVIVWKASFHYLQAMLMLLGIVYWAQQYLYSQKVKYAWFAVLLYIAAAFSLELFYVTPWFVLTLVIYYRKVLRYDRALCRKAALYFILPLFLVFIAHIVLLYTITGCYAAHLGPDIVQPATNYLRKLPLHIFHIFFFGRFFVHNTRHSVYAFFETVKGLSAFYGLLALLWVYIAFRFRHFKPDGKAAVLILVWLHFCAVIVSPVWFASEFLVIYDRYAYILLPFFYLLFLLLLAQIRIPAVIIPVFLAYCYCNIHLTRNESRFWRQSQDILTGMVHTVPPAGNKTILMLNLPLGLNGIPMIESFPKSSFKVLYNATADRPLTNTVYDVLSYNMTTENDGAHVQVINDSTIHVTLNQWGTWWWYGVQGGTSYQNAEYRLNLVDLGHWYELTLKRPAANYLLLYQAGNKLKAVDLNKKNTDQY